VEKTATSFVDVSAVFISNLLYLSLKMFYMYWQLEKRRKRLKMKLEMAKFLQDTIEETALQRKGSSGKGETVQEFVQFMDEVQ